MAASSDSILAELVPVLTIVGSFAAAWMGARLSLRNFYMERRWDRKADAYTIVFEAIRDTQRWYEQHFKSLEVGTEIDDDRKKRLQDEANQAEAKFERCLAGQVWNLPEDFRERAWKLSRELGSFVGKTDSWFEYLDGSLALIQEAVEELAELAKKDLR